MSEERDSWSRFLSTPMEAVAADVMGDRWIGRRFGSYEVGAPLGAGGMGEVYRARDTRLGRDVAVKVLAASFTADRDRVARFEREARVLAALNHPHIASIYAVEDVDEATVLVLELVDGETLADRIARGPLPIAQAIDTARQIADALEAAHEKGVIHRDLKPSNIAVTKDGVVKVLDFGLAKADGAAMNVSQSPTVTVGGTREGVLLGTAAYMSPEQARGESVDKRTDIWSFGCVVYELLTGRKAFDGATVSDHIAAVLEREPDWNALPASTPEHVRHVVRRCLEKDTRRRLRDIADARIEMGDESARPPVAITDPPVRSGAGRRIRRLVVPVGLAALALVLAIVFSRPPTPPTRAVTRFAIALPAGLELPDGALSTLAISPDGRTVGFVGWSANGSQLYLRSLDRMDVTPVADTAGATVPIFSADGQSIAFISPDNQLKIAALGGGGAQRIVYTGGLQGAAWTDTRSLLQSGSRGVAWTDDGSILYASILSPLYRVSASGGVSEAISTLDRAKKERSHRWPHVLPGSKAVLITVSTSDNDSFDDARIEALDIASGKRKLLIQGGTDAQYIATGHVVYAHAGTLLAVPFDVNRLEVTGQPRVVLNDVATDPIYGVGHFAASRDGTLVYAPGGVRTHNGVLMWVDRRGHAEPVADVHRPFANGLALSPDGQRIAVELDGANTRIWLFDIRRTTLTPVAREWDNQHPVWARDGTRVAFYSSRTVPVHVFWQPTDGTDTAEQLTAGPDDQIPDDWSADGRFLIFHQLDPKNGFDLWSLSMADRKPQPLLQTPAAELNAKISPDGRWMAYQSNQSGRFEIYVRAFPGPSRTWQVSIDGGTRPVWAHNGRELFFRNGNRLFAVDESTGLEFVAGKPQMLFEGPYLQPYDVASDGRFLMIKPEPQPLSQLTVVQNWGEELKMRMAAK